MAYIGISKAPDDPIEKEKWARDMANIQIGMWVADGATCVQCGHTYTSVEDFRRCNPKRGYGQKFNFVCNGCWDDYDNAQNSRK